MSEETGGGTVEGGVPRHSYWLLPDEPWATRLRGDIAKLARHFGTPVFEPHVTVQGNLPQERDELARQLPLLDSGGGRLELRVAGVETSAERFRSLYLRLEDTPRFDSLVARSLERCAHPEGAPPFAHLSLAYGDPLGRSSKRNFVEALASEYGRAVIGFSCLALARSSSELPIEEWRLLELQPL